MVPDGTFEARFVMFCNIQKHQKIRFILFKCIVVLIAEKLK